MQKCAVFSCLGLGDGLISLVLSNNLRLNGHAVTTFHPFLKQMQEWFPRQDISPFPPLEKLGEELKTFDRFFFFFEKTPWMEACLSYCQRHFPKKTTVLNPIATARCDYLYWEQGKFDGRRTFVDNLYRFCQEILKLEVVTKDNGIRMLPQLTPRRNPQQVVIHPMSSREGKNWPREKFRDLAERLKGNGYHPLFLLTQEERMGWDLKGIEAPFYSSLSQVAEIVCESGYMVGNDSGIGHLASCLNIPTVTICRNGKMAHFWKPGWAPGRVISPSLWIPNLKGTRWRDRHWKKWISTRRVFNHFLSLRGY